MENIHKLCVATWLIYPGSHEWEALSAVKILLNLGLVVWQKNQVGLVMFLLVELKQG